MSKRLILMLALAFIIGISTYAYAEVQNIKVSGDILLRGVYREAFTLDDYEWPEGTDNSTDAQDTFLLNTVRARLDADLTDNVAAAIRILNERTWGDTISTGSSSEDDDEVLIDLAYLTLREFLYSPLTLTVGRQELRFGNALIVGDPDTNIMATYWIGGSAPGLYIMPAPDLSARKAFDAIRATLDYSPWVVDLILSKIDENDQTVKDDIDLRGINARYDFADDNNTIAEVYYFERDSATNAPGYQDDTVRALGVRAQSMPIDNFLLNAEVAHQSGTYTASATTYPNDTTYGGRTAGQSDKRDAWAVQLGADYLFADKKYTPSLGIWYTYLSGDKDGNLSGETYRAWHPMFEDQGTGTIANAILAYSNCHVLNVNGGMRPRDDTMVMLKYTHITLDKPYTNGNTKILSGVYGNATYLMTDRDHVGDEVDLLVTYDYTEDVQLGLNAGVFIPGSAFDSNDTTGNDRNAAQLIGSMQVTF
jgi:hypothetical protein